MFMIGTNFWQIKNITMAKRYNQSMETNHNPNWSYIYDRLYRILIISGLGLDKTNVLLNLIKHQRPYIDNIYLYFKDPFQ